MSDEAERPLTSTPLQGSDVPTLNGKEWSGSWPYRCDEQHQGAFSKNLPPVPAHEHYPKVPRNCVQHRNLPIWPSNTVSGWPSDYPRFPPPPTLLHHPQFPVKEAEMSVSQEWGLEEPKIIWPHWRWDEVYPLMEEGGASTHCYQPDVTTSNNSDFTVVIVTVGSASGSLKAEPKECLTGKGQVLSKGLRVERISRWLTSILLLIKIV